MLVKIVSKKTVSFENSKFPKLGLVSKSFLQDVAEKIRITITIESKYLIEI